MDGFRRKRDVKNNSECQHLTKEELNTLSLGLLSLINGINTALNNIYDADSIDALKRARDKYTELDQKFVDYCDYVERK